jgi:hypothetical protein
VQFAVSTGSHTALQLQLMWAQLHMVFGGQACIALVWQLSQPESGSCSCWLCRAFGFGCSFPEWKQQHVQSMQLPHSYQVLVDLVTGLHNSILPLRGQCQ